MHTIAYIIDGFAISFGLLLILAVVGMCRSGGKYDRETERLYQALKREEAPQRQASDILSGAALIAFVAMVGVGMVVLS
jgi:hypothetical protein